MALFSFSFYGPGGVFTCHKPMYLASLCASFVALVLVRRPRKGRCLEPIKNTKGRRVCGHVQTLGHVRTSGPAQHPFRGGHPPARIERPIWVLSPGSTSCPLPTDRRTGYARIARIALAMGTAPCVSADAHGPEESRNAGRPHWHRH